MSARQKHKASASSTITGAAEAARQAVIARCAAILAHFKTVAARGDAASSREALAAELGVSWFTIKRDLSDLRRDKLIESESRKWLARPTDKEMTVEMRYRVEVGGVWTWTAWPTDGPPAKARATAAPLTAWWLAKTSRVAPAADHQGPVERAKSTLRVALGVAVYHARTVDVPDKAFKPSRQPPGDALVIVAGRGAMTETAVVALAAQLGSGVRA